MNFTPVTDSFGRSVQISSEKVFGGKGLCAQNSRNSPKPYLFTGIIPQITGSSLDLLNPEMNLKYSG